MEDLKTIIPEQTWNDLMTEVALENALTGNSYSSSSAAPPSTNQGISVKQRLVDPILEGASFVSKTRGARIEMLRDSNIGMRVLNENSSEIFKILVGGTDVGDIIIGDYDGGQGAKWDDSMGTFDVLGTFQATIGKIGGFDIGADYIRDTANTFGLASTATSGDDIRIWGGASFANRASANFYITESGQALFKYVTISGGSNVKFISDTIDTENKNILKDFTFGSSDYSGAFKSGDITWDTSTGLVTGGTGIVMHKGGIVGAKNGNPTFSINASTGDATFAGTLSAASGTLGVITTGQITLDTTGYVRGGMTSYMTGVGFFLGYSDDAYKFSVGNSSGDYISWNGSNLFVSGMVSSVKSYKTYAPWYDSEINTRGITLQCSTSKPGTPDYMYAVFSVGSPGTCIKGNMYGATKVWIRRYKKDDYGEFSFENVFISYKVVGYTSAQYLIYSIAHCGNYVYVVMDRRTSDCVTTTSHWEVHRYNEDLTNDTTMSGLSESTISSNPYIITDQTYLYFINTSNGNVKKVSIDGTTLTDQSSDFTCSGISRYAIGTTTRIYSLNHLEGTLREFDYTGTQKSSQEYYLYGATYNGVYNIGANSWVYDIIFGGFAFSYDYLMSITNVRENSNNSYFWACLEINPTIKT